jgi:hypothetical protein
MYRDLSTEEKQIYSSEVFNETKVLVEQSIKTPDMDLSGPDEDDCNCGESK